MLDRPVDSTVTVTVSSLSFCAAAVSSDIAALAVGASVVAPAPGVAPVPPVAPPVSPAQAVTPRQRAAKRPSPPVVSRRSRMTADVPAARTTQTHRE